MLNTALSGLKTIAISVAMIVIVAGVFGCASVRVKTDYDRSVDFSGFTTYHWDREHSVPSDALARDPLLRKRIKNAVDKVLQAKGFVLRDAGPADFSVSIHAGAEERKSITNRENYGWYDPWRGPYGGQIDISYYTQGSLVIDVYGAKTNELAWRGIGEEIVREYSDNEKMEADILKTVTEILKDFPPHTQHSQGKE